MEPMDTQEGTGARARGLADQLTARAEAAGSSLQEASRNALEDMAKVIQRYPVQTLLVGIAAGYVLSKLQQRWLEG